MHVMSSFNTCLCQAPRLPWVSPARPQRCSAARARLVVSPAQSPGRKDKALTYGFTSWLRLLLPPNSLETGRRILQGFFLQLPASRDSARLGHPRSLLQSPGGATGCDRDKEGLETEHISSKASAVCSLQPIPFQPPARRCYFSNQLQDKPAGPCRGVESPPGD